MNLIRRTSKEETLKLLSNAATTRGLADGVLFTKEMPLARIYVDMDGTLTEFHDVDHDTLYTPGYFRNLKANKIALNGLKQFLEIFDDDGRFEVSILSNYLTDRENSREEKEEWLNENAPWLKDYGCNVIFNPCGTSKLFSVPAFDPVANPVVNILLDDHTPNLIDFCGYSKGEKYLNTDNAIFGNEGIKLVNGINDRKGWWKSAEATRVIWANQNTIYAGDMVCKHFAFNLYLGVMDILTEYMVLPQLTKPNDAKLFLECFRQSLGELRYCKYCDAVSTILQAKAISEPVRYEFQTREFKHFDEIALFLLLARLACNKQVLKAKFGTFSTNIFGEIMGCLEGAENLNLYDGEERGVQQWLGTK